MNTEHVRRWRYPEAFWGAESRHQGDLETAKNQRIKNAQLQFDLWPLKIKQPGTSEENNQVIKHTFCQSKNSIAVANASTGDIKWLPLAVAEWISGNDRHLAQHSQMQVTDYSTWVSGWNPAKSGCHPWNAGELEGLLSMFYTDVCCW